MSESYIFASVPVRLAASHGVNRPGFHAVRHGVFSSFPNNSLPDFVTSASVANVVILETAVSSLNIGQPSGDNPESWQQLTVLFNEEQPPDKVTSFLDRMAIALTASYAPTQQDPWYGNLFVELDWSNLRLSENASGLLEASVVVWSGVRSVDHKVVNESTLQALYTTNRMKIFVDGMRAGQAKSKYANWFILVEELEALATTKFLTEFTPVLPIDKREEIVKLSGLTGEPKIRLKTFLGHPNHTLENREEKLHKILIKTSLNQITLHSGSVLEITLNKSSK
jgi:hypothetical protein